MSWLLDGARSLIGFPTSGNTDQQRQKSKVLERRQEAAKTSTYEDRAAAFSRAQNMKIRQAKGELADLETQIKAAQANKNWPAVKSLLTEKQKIQSRLDVLEKKQNNMLDQQTAIQNANSNLEQGLLTQEGANELSDAVAAMEEIKLDDAVDKIQDAAGEMQEHDLLLSEPLFGARDANVTEFEVDEELERMMREQEEEEAARAAERLPSVNVKVNVDKKDGVATAQKEEKEKERGVGEEIDEIKN